MWQTDSDLHFDELSDSVNDAYETKSVEKQLLDLINDRDQWRHKYEVLLSVHNRQEHNLASELQSLEGEVKSLSSRIYDLTTEKKAFVESTNELLLENSRLQAALDRERKACSREIATIASQFAELKTKFQRYKGQVEASPSELREENAELRLTISKLQEELRTAYTQSRHKSPIREASTERPKASHSRKSSKRSLKDVI